MATLIFVHGLCGERSDFKAQTDALSAAHEVIAVDLPGHGDSPLPAHATVAALAAPLVDLAQRLSGRQIVLVGHSIGCRVILEASQHFGRQPAGVVFIEQSLVAGRDVEQAIEALENRFNSIGAHAFLTAAFSGMFLENAPEELRQRVLARVRATDPAFLRQIVLDGLRWEGRAPELLSRLRAPVLMVQSTCLDENFRWHGMRPGVTAPWTELVMSKVADAELRIVSGAGHFAMIESPQIVTGYIVDFLNRIPGPASRTERASP